MFTNTDSFRERVLQYKQTGLYCEHPFNLSPYSKYFKFWAEEARRCMFGYSARGYKITGDHYFYLNYCPIEITTGGEDSPNGSMELIAAKRETDFPAFWDGDFDWYMYVEECRARGLHAVCLKSRTKGFSYKGAAMLNRNFFLVPKSKGYVYAYDNQFLTGDGILTKTWSMMEHINEHTGFKKRISKPDEFHRTAMWKEKTPEGHWLTKGFQSEVIGVSLNDDKTGKKVRGKRGQLVLWEEAGANPYLLQSWPVAMESMRIGRKVFGLMVCFGTGGTEGADIQGLEELTYNPGYDVLHIPNKWDEGAGQDSKCGFFVPVFKNLEGFMDKDGNSNEEMAKAFITGQREYKMKNTSDPSAVTRYIAENPFSPQEALMRVGGNFFPVKEIKAQIAELQTNKHRYEDKQWVGTLEVDRESKGIIWSIDELGKPITDFPRKSESSEGAIVIWEHPKKNNEGVIPYGLYIAGNDPYDQDDSTTDSLGSTFIMNRVTAQIVAEYTGRPKTAVEYYENVRRLLIYYNARMNYENNLKGLFTYFEQKNSLYLLCDLPEVVEDKIADKVTQKRRKGTPGTLPVKKWGCELIKTWLLTPTEPDSEILNVHKIYSVPLLKELAAFNFKAGNYDRVMSLIYTLILFEDSVRIVVEMDKKIKTLGEDSFFERNFKGR